MGLVLYDIMVYSLANLPYQPSSSSNRAYGSVWVTVNGEPKNVTDMLLSEGWAEVKQTGKQNE